MEIAIFGSGIAGLMTAVTLSALGNRCRIFERTSQSRDSGMGFILMPESIGCLTKYGVHLNAVDTGSSSLRRYYQRNSRGDVLHQEPMPPLTLGIRRRDLIDALIHALPDGSIFYDAELACLEFDKTSLVTSARLSTGERVSADLYIAADGLRSQGRQTLFPDWPAPKAQVLEIVGIVHADHAARWAGDNFNKFNACTGNVAFGIVPVGAGDVVWYMQFNARKFPPPGSDVTARRDFVNDLVGGWGDPIPHLIRATDFSRVHVWHPVDADMIPHFHSKNLVLVGDAAHPLLPFTSQGATSAIADAITLSHALEAEHVLSSALAAYSVERRAQCLQYIEQGREMTHRFLSPQVVHPELLPIAK